MPVSQGMYLLTRFFSESEDMSPGSLLLHPGQLLLHPLQHLVKVPAVLL